MKTLADIPERLRQVTRTHIGFCKNCWHAKRWHEIGTGQHGSRRDNSYCRACTWDWTASGHERCPEYNPITPMDYLRFRQMLKDSPRPAPAKKAPNTYPGKQFVLKYKDQWLKKGSWNWTFVDSPAFATLFAGRSNVMYQAKNRISVWNQELEKSTELNRADIEIHLITLKMTSDERIEIK
jgi:hypothetical protein